MLISLLVIILANADPFLKVGEIEPRSKHPNCKKVDRKFDNSGNPTDTINCIECENNYFKLENGECVYNPTNCNVTDPYVYLNDKECKFCDYGCNTCDQSGECTCDFNSSFDTCKQCVSTYDLKSGSVKTTKCKYCGQGLATNVNMDGCVDADSGTEVFDKTNCALSGLKEGKQVCLKCFGNKTMDTQKLHCQTELKVIEGCIRQNGENCLKCDVGYILSYKACKKTDENCNILKETSSDVICKSCREGYYINDKGTCTMCEVNGDINKQYDSLCELYDTTKCTQCNKRCKVDRGNCVSNHCVEFKSDGKCGICEDGYYALNGECNLFSNDGLDTSSGKPTCKTGYYLDYNIETKIYSCKKCKGHFMECLTADTPMPGSSLYDNWKATKAEPCDDENCAQCADDGVTCYKCAFNNGNPNGVLLNGKCILTPTDIILEIVDNYDTTYKFCKYKGVNSFFEELVPAYNETTNPESKCNPLLRRSYMYKTQTKENSNYECAKNNRDVIKNCMCKNGYYQKNASTVTDCEKINSLEGCIESANGKHCTLCATGAKYTSEGKCVCPTGTYLKDEKCEKCPEKCATCVWETGQTKVTCKTCQPEQYNGQGRDPTNQCECNVGYVTEPGKIDVCVQKIEGCSTDGKYVVQNKQINCLACDKEHMAIGFGTTQCSQCVDGYYMDDKKVCQMCNNGIGCLTCSATACTQCKDGNAVLNGPASEPTKYCTICKDGFTFNSTDGTCARCPSVCNGCEIKDGNIECKECKNKRNPPKCECDQGVYLDPNTNTCVACPNDLIVCKKECDYGNGIYVHCTECVDELREPTTNCTTCKDTNMFLDSEGNCEQCAENCNVCTDKEHCTVCDPKTFRTGFTCEKCVKGYYLDIDKCKQCDSKCENCTSATDCEKCIDVNRKPVPGKMCEGCNDGYYLSGESCLMCSKNCKVCEDQTKCVKCAVENFFEETPVDGTCVCIEGYVYDTKTQTCDPCKDKLNEFCSSCSSEKCSVCNAEYFEAKGGKCVCKEGYYTTSWGACVPCDRHISGCVLCDGKDSCSKCKNGYTLNKTSGKCNGAMKIVIMMVAIVLALLF
ncbi:furin repeat-containing protein, putative [Entamoeba invadens IP1]|uniref:Furin repeat-containing protein, putative n=1 Tax=Entamoeba invadens IP1 TaxID=370355 RepID=L7FM81_ENTIV|nr:furin repeat-containing protein, putative [Entamoeba invadens IP1]ELP88720.1 furin repeat-containing protein, putative [Entamoeba invadens IP1]|eukprot:XP_004255491.1 furin repeat-containing protein, putative [Entamoeba invadens IP1]